VVALLEHRLFRLGSRNVACVLLGTWLMSIAGCKTFADHTAKTRTALDGNAPDKALKASNAALGVRRADQQPTPLKKNDALLLLDRAMVLQSLADYPASSLDFQVADKAIEILDFSRSTADEISRYLFSDNAGPYKARPYEKLLLNTLNMINYLVQRNLQGAKVEARRFTVMRDYLRGNDEAGPRKLGPADAPGSYLAGYSFEKADEPGPALRYYDEALQSGELSSLAAPVKSLMQRSGYRTPLLESSARSVGNESPPTSESPRGELLILVNYGRVPALVAKRVPIGVALTIAAVFLPPSAAQQARRLAGQGLVTWVNYPELGPAPAHYAQPVVTVDGVGRQLEQVANIDAIVQQAWNESRGRVVAAAVTRMIARAAIGAGVGVATGKATKRGGVGMLAAVVAQGAMVAADKPDTRSWATLPARMSLVRMQLSPGAHRVEVNVSGRRYAYEVTIESAQWTVLNVTDLSRS
jgi:hypothetical protein